MFVSFHGWTLIKRKMVERKAFLTNPKHQYLVSQYGEEDCHANNTKNRDYFEYPSLPPLSNELWLKRKWSKEKLSLQIQTFNIVSPITENTIAKPIRKRMQIVMGIQVCLISRMNIDCKENGGKKAFLQNPQHQHHVSQYGEHDWSANNKQNGD